MTKATLYTKTSSKTKLKSFLTCYTQEKAHKKQEEKRKKKYKLFFLPKKREN